MIEVFNKICEATENYVLASGVKGYEDLKLMLTLSDITIRNNDKKDNVNYHKKYTFKQIDKLVSNFLNYLNPEYKKYYDLRKEDGTIIFDNRKESYYNQCFSMYDDIHDERIIYIVLKGTIEDAYTIVHELFHDINVDEKNQSTTRFIFSESLSLLGEILLDEYLIKNKFRDCDVASTLSLVSLKEKAIKLNFNINLVLEFLKDKYIDTGKIISVIEDSSLSSAFLISREMRRIEETGILSIDYEQTYILGMLIATYMYDRIKNNKNNIMELFELNQQLKNYTFDQVLDYLELDYNEFDLNENAYEELEKCYKKYIKSR